VKLTFPKVLSRNRAAIGGKTVWKTAPASLTLVFEVPRRTKHHTVTLLRLCVLGAIFLIPLSIGIVLATNNANRGEHAYRISHDVGSMYAQGLDFSARANQNIAFSIAEGAGIDMQNGKGVLILSKIRMVHASDCAAAKCINQGYPVVTERYVLGNRSLRTSSFGTPATIDPSTGKVRDWMNDQSARANNFAAALKPGEVTYAAECYVTSPESPLGIYSRSLF
jgi:hypothetical protein